MGEKDNHVGRASLIIIIAIMALLLSRMAILKSSDTIDRKRYSDPVVSSSLVRGTIYDRNGNLLAFQAPDYGFNVSLSSSSPSYVASILSPYLSYDAIAIEEIISKGSTFLPLVYVPTKEESIAIDKLLYNLALSDEVKLVLKEMRKHPSGMNANELIGSVDEYLNGISGIEKLYDSYLRATPKLGYSVVKGSSIVLTLDMDLQFAIERMPLLKDYQDSTIAILSNSNEILAYHGKGNDDVLNSLVYSITTDDKTEIVSNPSPFENVDTIDIGNYRIYISAESEYIQQSILNGVKTALYTLGKITPYSV